MLLPKVQPQQHIPHFPMQNTKNNPFPQAEDLQRDSSCWHITYIFIIPFCLSSPTRITAATCRCVFSSSLHSIHSVSWTVSASVCFFWSPSRCLSDALLIGQAEEKLSVFLLHRLQPLLLSCKQVPKMQSEKTADWCSLCFVPLFSLCRHIKI